MKKLSREATERFEQHFGDAQARFFAPQPEKNFPVEKQQKV